MPLARVSQSDHHVPFPNASCWLDRVSDSDYYMFHFAKNAANFTENMISTVSKSMLPTSIGTLSVLLFKACCQLIGIITISHTPHGMLLTSQWSLFLLPTSCCWLQIDHYSYSPKHVANFTVIIIPTPPTACCCLDHYKWYPSKHVPNFTFRSSHIIKYPNSPKRVANCTEIQVSDLMHRDLGQWFKVQRSQSMI